MPRKRTGTKEFKRGRWLIKLTVDLRGGGTERRRVWLPTGTTEDQAEAKRLSLAAKAAGRLFEPREPLEAPGADLLWEDYVERWLLARIARGLRSVRKDRQRLRDHVTPTLKGKRMGEIEADDLRRVVVELDRKIHDPEVRFDWLTAKKSWGAVTKLFNDAAGSKDPSLRILRTNPCRDVEGPDRGYQKIKQWLYPLEFAALARCEDVPLRWRRIYAVAIYLYLRVSELRALHWEDLDLVHGVAFIHRSTDERGRKLREHTKTGSVRRFRLEPTLLALLRAMAPSREPRGLVFASVNEPAGELRRHLLRAGVRREELHVGTATSLPLWFHDLRASGITWAAVRGDSAIEIRDRAGHRDLEQTNEYIRRAAGVGDVGEPFPELGPLFGSVPGIVPEVWSDRESSLVAAGSVVRRGGLEPPGAAPALEKTAEIAGSECAKRTADGAGDNSGDNSEGSADDSDDDPLIARPAAWALALAAEGLRQRTRVHWPLVVRKGAKRAG